MKTLTITLATATLALSLTAGPAMAETPTFTLKTTERAMFGTRQIDNGQFDAGAERLERMLALAGSSIALRQPALNDLCVAYTMMRDFDAAQQRCEESVANGRDTGAALNNRGVLHIAMGNYDAGARDFAAAIEAGGVDATAEQNLLLAQQRVAEQRTRDDVERAADNAPENRVERDGNERAARVEAAVGRFAQLIEAETLELAVGRAEDLAS